MKAILFLIFSFPSFVIAQNTALKSHPVFNDSNSLYTNYDTLNVQFGSVFFSDALKNVDLFSQVGILYSKTYKKFNLSYYGAFNSLYLDKNLQKKYTATQTLIQFGRLQKLNNSLLWNYQHFFHLSYHPDSLFSFEIARDAPKYGYGYNSLLLDNKHSPYSYASADAKIWHLEYRFSFNLLSDKKSDKQNLDFKRKYMVNHLLSWNINKGINFNFFESVVWAPVDSFGTRGIDVNYLDPVIFFRPVEFALGSPDNAFLGLGLNIRLFKQFYLYSQVLLDEFVLSQVKARTGWWGNKQALQAGLKTETLFGVQNLGFLGELNIIRPFVYAHENNWQNYGNLHQSLGYVWGSNQVELLAKLNWKYGRWKVTNLTAFRHWAQDSSYSESLGNDIYKSYNLRTRDYNHSLFQGISSIIYETNISLNYLLFPKQNLNAFAGIHYQILKTESSTTDLLFTIGLLSSLAENKYNIMNILRNMIR